MILLDTSVWVEHLRSGLQTVVDQLEKGDPLTHPWLVAFLANLSSSDVACPETEILRTIEAHGLMGRGIGYVDCRATSKTEPALCLNKLLPNLIVAG